MQYNLPSLPENENESTFNIKEQIDRYLVHWKWFTLSTVICLFVAFIYLRYATPEYSISATILIKDDKKGGLANELSTFSDLGLMAGAKSNVDNEIEVLKARTLVANTVEELKFNILYLNKGNVKTTEVYRNSPIRVNFFNKSEDFNKRDTLFRIKTLSETKFELFDSEDISKGIYKYGSPIKNKLGNMVVTIDSDSVAPKKKNIVNKDIIVVISPLQRVVEIYKNKLQVNAVNKMTSVISLSLTDRVGEKGVDFLNRLIKRYNKDAIDDKNQVAMNTEVFINQRLEALTGQLDTVERGAERFKKIEGLTDIPTDAELFIKSASEYEKSVLENETKLKVVSYLLDFLSKSSNNDLIPANLIPEGEASSLINEYNKLILQKNATSRYATELNEQIKNINSQIEGLRFSVEKSLKNEKSSLQLQKNDLKRQEGIVGGKISEVPRQEREFRVIQRQQNVKEALYLYLLQKREENAISLAVTAPNAKIIDAGYASPTPVSPKSNIILLAALLVGLLVPFLIIYLRDLLDTKIHSNIDLEKIKVPYLGDVPRSETNSELVNLHGRSGTAEALRIIRTNLEFMLNEVPEGIAKTIFVTSTIPKEGKTFISVNLATTIAMTGKKNVIDRYGY